MLWLAYIVSKWLQIAMPWQVSNEFQNYNIMQKIMPPTLIKRDLIVTKTGPKIVTPPMQKKK